MKFLILLVIIGFVAAAPVSKDELIKRATDLEARLAAAVTKVKDSKPDEAKIMEAESKNLKTIVAELEAAKEPAVVARLETLLASVEATVEKRLKQNEFFFVAAPTKEELLKRATDLEARLTAAEAKVKTTHPAEVRVLESEIKSLQTLAKELEAATEAAVVSRLEMRLASVERTAEVTLRRIEGNTRTTAAAATTAASFVGAPTKEELIQKATDLEAQLQTAVEKVRTSHPQEARILETEIRELKSLAGELSTATNTQVVAHLEQRLTGVERRAEETLKRIDGRAGTTTAASFEVAAPTKEELEKRATDLEARLQADIDKVRASHPIEARILESEVRELKLLAGELATAKNATVVAHLETRLQGVERRSEETLRRIDGRTGRPTTDAPATTASSAY